MIHRGASIDLPIALSIDPQQPVGSLTGSLSYDPAVVRPTRCLSAATGGDDAPMGYCNVGYDLQAGIIRFTLLSAAGMTGPLAPFTVSFEAVTSASDGDTSPLDLSAQTVTSPQGDPLRWQAEDTKLHLQAPIAAPRVLIGPPAATGIYTVTLGSTETVQVWVEGVTDLGAATLSIRYDPAAAQALSCRLSGDLFDGGFCSMPADTGTIHANVVAGGGFTGTGLFYEIVFTHAPRPTCLASTPLTVMVESSFQSPEIPSR